MKVDKKLVESVLKAASKGKEKKKLSCKKALLLAEEHGVKPAVVGKICDREMIKLTSCQLGCFK